MKILTFSGALIFGVFTTAPLFVTVKLIYIFILSKYSYVQITDITDI